MTKSGMIEIDVPGFDSKLEPVSRPVEDAL
jgi:hypothetical protein